MMIELKPGTSVDPQHIVSVSISGNYPNKHVEVSMISGAFVISSAGNPDFSADKLYARILSAKDDAPNLLDKQLPAIGKDDDMRRKALNYDLISLDLIALGELLTLNRKGNGQQGESVLKVAIRALSEPVLTPAEILDLEWAIEAAADWFGGLVDEDEKSEHRTNVARARDALAKVSK